MQVSGLKADEGGARTAVHRLGQGCRQQPTFPVCVYRDRRAQAEVAQRKVDDVVPLPADEHPDARRTAQPPPGQVPAHLVHHLLPTGRESHEIRHRRARREADIRAGGESEQIEQPGRCGLLGCRGGRCGEPHTRILVPRADEPIGREGRRECPADHPAEEPAGLHGHEPRLGERGEFIDHRGRGRWATRAAGPKSRP